MGPAGSGQTAKLINNALLMMNQKNVQDILALAKNLDLDLSALTELLLAGTGRSFALEALTGAVTLNSSQHPLSNAPEGRPPRLPQRRVSRTGIRTEERGTPTTPSAPPHPERRTHVTMRVRSREW